MYLRANAGCFAAGTKLDTPTGFRAVEEIWPDDLLYSRNEFDPDGPVEVKVVEARFERTGCILHLHLVGGAVVRTTREHPCSERRRGWTAAGELGPGDEVRTALGWVTVEEVFDTGEWETVYNFRVADHHTYFVGDENWSFSVWAHNEYSTEVNAIIQQVVTGQGGRPGRGSGGRPARPGSGPSEPTASTWSSTSERWSQSITRACRRPTPTK